MRVVDRDYDGPTRGYRAHGPEEGERDRAGVERLVVRFVPQQGGREGVPLRHGQLGRNLVEHASEQIRETHEGEVGLDLRRMCSENAVITDACARDRRLPHGGFPDPRLALDQQRREAVDYRRDELLDRRHLAVPPEKESRGSGHEGILLRSRPEYKRREARLRVKECGFPRFPACSAAPTIESIVD